MRRPELEFSRRTAVGELSAGGRAFAVEATAEECSRLASRLDLLALLRLQAEGVVAPLGVRGDVRLAGRIEAEVEQTCVVSLEPFRVRIEIPIERLYSPRLRDEWADAGEYGGEPEIEGEGGAFFEPLIGSAIDIGEAVVEELALALDPYPRKPGTTFPNPRPEASVDEPSAAASPFAMLHRQRRPGESS